MNKITVSTVTPVYSGKPYLAELVKLLSSVKEEWESSGRPIELKESIFVIDEAIDGSAELLSNLAVQFPWIHILHLSRNFGQHPATIAGILYTSGEWVVTLDEDLQHHPQHILAMLRRVPADGLDIVYASPSGTVHEHSARDLFSHTYKLLMSKILGSPYIRLFNSFRLIRGSIARAAASVCSHETYFDMSLCWFTCRIGTLSMPLRDIRHLSGGHSGYTFRGLLEHARRLTMSSRFKLLRAGVWIGGVAVGASLLAALVIFSIKIYAPTLIPVRGWTSLFLLVLFFGGFTSFLESIVIEVIATLSLQLQGKPPFFVVDRSRDKLLRQIV